MSGPQRLHRPANRRRGFLAVTRSRLILQDRLTFTTVVRTVGLSLGVIALAVLFLEGDVVTFFAIAGAGVTLGAGSRLIEPFAVGRTWVDHGDIVFVDADDRRVVVSGPWHDRMSIEVIDPVDLQTISEVVARPGESAA